MQFPALLRRQFVRTPAHSLTVALLLALGVGANAAIFALVQAVLLNPLPYPDAARLVTLNQLHQRTREVSSSWPNAQDWKTLNRSFSQFGVSQALNLTLTGRGGAERLPAAAVTADYFPTVGIAPSLGRYFSADEDRAGGTPVVLISHGLWQRTFGGRADVLGQSLELDGALHTIVGVASPDLALPAPVDLWVPLTPRSANADWQKRDNGVGLSALGRLRPGVSIADARTEFAQISDQLARAHPEVAEMSANLVPLLDRVTGAYRAPLWLLAGAVGLLLVIACANVASLQLTRGLSRAREFAIRAALGSNRSQMIGQLLVENLVLAVFGALGGVALAYGGLELVQAWTPAAVARVQAAQISGGVLAFSAGLAVLASLAAGVWPAVRATRVDLRSGLQAADKGGDTSSRQFGRQAIVAVQVALTLVLLAGSLLFARSLTAIDRFQFGFDPSNLLVFRVSLPAQNYRNAAARAQFLETLQTRLRELPGVLNAGYNLSTPLRTNWQTRFNVEGRAPFPEGTGPLMEVGVTGPTYFETLRVPVLRGRNFNATDVAGARVAIIDQAFAEQMWPGEDAVGKTLLWDVGLPAGPRVTVVGVVPTVEMNSHLSTDRLFQIYVPLTQLGVRNVSFVVRTALPPRALLDTVRATVHAQDALVPVYDVATMEEMIAAGYSTQALTGRLVGLFAGTALLLSTLGLYGLVAFAVRARERELGVRLALGAAPGQLVRLVLRQGALPLLAGAGLGLLAVLAGGRLMRGFLYQTSPFDWVALAGSLAVLGIIALVALWLPARRAARADPMTALRGE